LKGRGVEGVPDVRARREGGVPGARGGGGKQRK